MTVTKNHEAEPPNFCDMEDDGKNSQSSRRRRRSKLTKPARLLARRMHARDGEPVDEHGMPKRVVYAIISVTFAVMGATVVLLSMTSAGSALSGTTARSIAAAALVVSPLWMIAGKHYGDRHHTAIKQVALLVALAAVTGASHYTGPLRGALLATMLMAPLMSALALPVAMAAPNVIVGAGAVFAVGMYSHEYGGTLRSVIMTLIALLGGTLVMLVRSAIVQANASNSELAEIDPLTGVANLRALDRRIDDELDRMNRGGQPFALIEFDLDDFKSVNDIHSHTTGDSLLVATAIAVVSTLNEADLVARRGGDEFVAVIPGCDHRNPWLLAQDCAQAVAAAGEIVCPGEQHTISFACVISSPGESQAQLRGRLDQELHNVKTRKHITRGGADRVEAKTSTSDASARAILPATLPEHSKDAAGEWKNPVHAMRAITWRAAAVIAGSSAIAVSAAMAVGIHGVTRDWKFAAVVLFALPFVPACLRMAKLEEPTARDTHFIASAAVILITAGGLLAGKTSSAAADLYLFTIILFAFILSARATFAYSAVAGALYTYFLITADYPQTAARVIATATTVGAITLIISFSRGGALEAANAQVNLASIDPLTRLPNLRKLRRRLSHEIARSHETGESLVLMMLDLDNFKLVNDRYSHTTGDQVLQAVAHELGKNVRSSELPARRGGDEFALVLPRTDLNAAAIVAARIQSSISRARFRICPDISPGAGIGFVEWDGKETADAFFQRADDALHDSKLAERVRRTPKVRLSNSA